jgi:YegS/Rv2252/BmrU family lipid kinase
VSEAGYAGRTLIVLNPISGQGDPARMRRQIGGAFAVRGASFDIAETGGRGDAERRARVAVGLGYRAVVAAGGDGTIAEIITGLAGSETPLGIIPLGTGNQIAANLGISSRVDRAVEIIVTSEPAAIDIGQLGDGRYFALMAGAGWDAEVMSVATRELKEKWGFAAYLFAGLRQAVSLPTSTYTITADDTEFEIRAASVIIANVGQLVYDLLPLDLRIGPGVSFHDGRLDICIFAPRSLPDVAAVLWRVASRRYVGDDRMIYLQAERIRIEADPPTITQVDGDVLGTTPLEARAVAGGVRVLLPA